MKNSFKTVLCTLLLAGLFAFHAVAEDKETKKIAGFASGIFISIEDKVNINIDKFNQKPTVIVVSDQRGTVLYREVVGKVETKLRRSLDLSQLPSGVYMLEISSDGEKQTKKIELSEKKPERVISMR